MFRGKRGSRGGSKDQKVEIPDEDPNANPREFRKAFETAYPKTDIGVVHVQAWDAMKLIHRMVGATGGKSDGDKAIAAVKGQVGVVRVAVTEPDFFAATSHPARMLIDRMGACVMGFVTGAQEHDDALHKEIKRIVQVVPSAAGVQKRGGAQRPAAQAVKR